MIPRAMTRALSTDPIRRGWALAMIVVGVSAWACTRDGGSVQRTLEAQLDSHTAYAACPARPCGGALASAERLSLGRHLTDHLAPRRHLETLTRLSATEAGLQTALEALDARGLEMTPTAVALARGALRHALAIKTGRPALLFEALASTDRALKIQPDMMAARFNRALILRDLGLCHTAALAFHRLGEADDSAWAGEARINYDALRCRQEPQRGAGNSTEISLDALVDANAAAATWARGVTPDAETLLHRAREELLSAPRAAVASLAAGRLALQANQLSQARQAFGFACQTLQDYATLGSWCGIWEGTVALYGGDLEYLRRTFNDWQRTDVRLLAGRHDWLIGLTELRTGNHSKALQAFARARAAFEGAGYSDFAAAIGTLEAETFANLGLLAHSWTARIPAITGLQVPRPIGSLHNGLIEGAKVADQMGATALADALLEEARYVSQTLGNPIIQIEVGLRRADMLVRRGQDRLARSEYELAHTRTNSLPKGDLRDRLDANAHLGLWMLPDATGDTDDLDQLTQLYRRLGPPWRELMALSRKAQLERIRRRPAEALATLDVAVGRIRAMARGPHAPDYLASVQQIFDERISLALQQGHDREALFLLEESRTATPCCVVAADARQILVLADLTDTIVWWLLHEGGLETGELSASEQITLRRLAATTRPSNRDLSDAYDALVRGIPTPEEELVIIPDGALYRIPFAALRNSRTGVRLIEERSIVLFPTLTAAQAKPSPLRGHAAIVGDPSIDPMVFPTLPPLPQARLEAQQVAALHGKDAVLLTGTDATLDAVRDAVASADILHLATHTLPAEQPTDDRFVLAGGVPVRAGDLLQAGRAPRLVVLSGCDTLGDRVLRAGGPTGLARAFIQHGTQAALTTLWPVDDDAATELTVAFHTHLRSGLRASHALREAQLDAIALDRTSLDWAAFQLIGDLASDTEEQP